MTTLLLRHTFQNFSYQAETLFGARFPRLAFSLLSCKAQISTEKRDFDVNHRFDTLDISDSKTPVLPGNQTKAQPLTKNKSMK